MSIVKEESPKGQSLQWTKVEEIRLFKWMTLFKPAGIHKHFHMICLLERLNKPDQYPIKLLQGDKGSGGKVFSGEDVWEHLDQYYDLEKADEVENRPYPNIDLELYHTKYHEDSNDEEVEDEDDEDYEVIPLQNRLTKETEFELPWEEYGDLMLEHAHNHNELEAEQEVTIRDEQEKEEEE